VIWIYGGGLSCVGDLFFIKRVFQALLDAESCVYLISVGLRAVVFALEPVFEYREDSTDLEAVKA